MEISKVQYILNEAVKRSSIDLPTILNDLYLGKSNSVGKSKTFLTGNDLIEPVSPGNRRYRLTHFATTILNDFGSWQLYLDHLKESANKDKERQELKDQILGLDVKLKSHDNSIKWLKVAVIILGLINAFLVIKSFVI